TAVSDSESREARQGTDGGSESQQSVLDSGARTDGMLTCPSCGYVHGSTDERGRPAGRYDDDIDRTPAKPDRSFRCPRCGERVEPGS
ncbi:MAG: hypothetical protein V5A25_12870, partial [Halovenus sp.]